jgi:CelD/BcsL family acetyltransferase involved in cellulose biosynthesis
MRMHMLREASASGRERVRLLPMAEVGPRDVDAWKILARQALEPNPFFEPEFVLPLAAARPQDDVHLLVVDRGGEWLFCMPVVMRWGWHKVPVPVLSTWLSQYTFLGTPLVASTSPDVLSTLLQGVKSLHSGLLMFEWLGGGGAVSARLSQAASEFGSPVLLWERFERAAIRPSVKANSHLSSKRRSDFARRRRALERECGGVVRLVDRTNDPSAVDEFLAIEASGWKGSEGTAIASRSDDILFFRQLCEDLAAAGRLKILALMCSRTVAMQCNFISNSVMFGFRTCYDESLSRFSPGALLLLDAIEDSSASEVTWLDSCTAPDNDLCNRLMPDRQPIETIVVGHPDPIGSMLIVTMRTAALLRRARIQVRERGILNCRQWFSLGRNLQAAGQ